MKRFKHITLTTLLFMSIAYAIIIFQNNCSNSYNTTAGRLIYADNKQLLHINKRTVAIVDGQTKTATCGGVWVKKYAFITAWHCVNYDTGLCSDDAGKTLRSCNLSANDRYRRVFLYSTYDDLFVIVPVKLRSGIIIAANPSSDLALIGTIDASKNIAVISTDLIDDGQVQIVAHPNGVKYAFNTADILFELNTTHQYWQKKANLFAVDFLAQKGSSGAGAWSDTGELLGICSFTHSDIINLGRTFFISNKEIMTFLNEIDY